MPQIRSRFKLVTTLVELALITTMFALYALALVTSTPMDVKDLDVARSYWFGTSLTFALGMAFIAFRWNILAEFVQDFRRRRLRVVR